MMLEYDVVAKRIDAHGSARSHINSRAVDASPNAPGPPSVAVHYVLQR